MPDVPTASFFLLGVWLLLYLKKWPMLGGLALGFTVSLRVSSVPFAGLLLLYALWKWKGNPDRLLMLALDVQDIAEVVFPFESV